MSTGRTSVKQYREQVARAMSEETWQALVVSEARRRRWRVYHTHDSRRSAAGFPDLCMVRPPRCLFVELKAVGGRLTDQQREWISDLSSCGTVEAYVWRPDSNDYLGVLR